MRQRRATWAWLFYAAFIVYGATIPFHFAGDWAAIRERLSELPLTPFVAPDTGRRVSIPDAVQNILFFLPFGALGLLASASARWTRVLVVTLAGAALSIGVEAAQLLTTDRVTSLADVMFNTTGAFLGAAAAWQLRALGAWGLRRLREEGLADVEELRPLAVSAITLIIAGLQPFDVTLEVGSVSPKVRSFVLNPWQHTALRDEGTMLMLAAFFAMTLASYLSVLGERHAGRKALAIGTVCAFALESMQLVITSRMPGLWDFGVMTTGMAIGAALWAVAARVAWPRFWLGVMAGVTCAAAVLQMLSPFELSPAYHSIGWFPFLTYYSRTTFETLSHVIQSMLIYFPLGFWLGRSEPDVRKATLVAVGLALAIAGPIEYGQGWVVGRYPDISDMAVGAFGAWLGVRAGLPKT